MLKKYSTFLVGSFDSNKIYIEYGEYLKILKYAKAGASDGSRGVLLGTKTSEGAFVYKVLEALYTGGEGIESPTFSLDSWGRISADITEYYSMFELLGEFSTHSPVTPIRDDYIMQDKFFTEKSNLLFIVDPAVNEEKMYLFNGKDFESVSGFYLFDRFENFIDLSLRDNVLRPLAREYEMRIRIFDDIKRKLKKSNSIIAVFLIILFLFTVYNIVHTFELENKIDYPLKEQLEWKSE